MSTVICVMGLAAALIGLAVSIDIWTARRLQSRRHAARRLEAAPSRDPGDAAMR